MDRRLFAVRMSGLLVGWLLLVWAVAWTGQQTQEAVQRVAVLAEEVRTDTCGSWLGTYQFLNIWAADRLSAKEAKAARQRFAADFKQHCKNYSQTFPDEQAFPGVNP